MDPAPTVARRFRAELLTKQWLMGVRRGWLHVLELKPSGWPAILKAFDTVMTFVDNLDEQVKYVRRGPYTSVQTMSDAGKLEAAFKKLRDAIAEKRRAAEHWMQVDQDPVGYGRGSFTKEQGEHMRGRYEEAFGEMLTAYVPTKIDKAKGQWNKTREAPVTELLDDVLEILRKDAARLQEAIKTEKDILDRGGEIDSPTEEAFKDPVFKEFEFGHMKVVVCDPKSNGHRIRAYVRILDVAHQLMSRKGFADLWYGVLFLQSDDYKTLGEAERRSYERAGYANLESVAGTYHSGDDIVEITAPADDRTIKTIIHELGHRYWYKRMSQANRARFEEFLRFNKPALMSPIKPETLQTAKNEILVIGADRKHILKEFEEDFRSSANSAEVEKVIGEYLPKFKQMVLTRDPIFDVMMKLFQPMLYGGDPREQRLYDSVNEVKKKYTGYEESAEVKFRKHLLPESFEGAWKRGMSEGMNAWLREAFKLHFEVVDAALEYIKHLDKIGRPSIDPDESRVLPVSEYGKTNATEAFAEAFAHYCLGKDMTHDQIETFREVLAMTYSYDRTAAVSADEAHARAESKKAWAATKKALANRSSGSHYDAFKAHEATAKAWRKVAENTPEGEARNRAHSIYALHIGIASRHEKDKEALERWEEDDMRGTPPETRKYEDVAKLWRTEKV